ncbi:MAG: hypothetical protein AAGA75_24575 [Cyanobacteria bacterium P01_E01_bin.6]
MIYKVAAIMRAISLIEHPPVIVLGAALLLMPMATHSERGRSPQRTTIVAQHPVLSSTSANLYRDNVTASSGSDEFDDSSHEQGNTESSMQFGLNFFLRPFRVVQPSNLLLSQREESHALSVLFDGNSHSLVAKAVGAAEGTRTPSGGYTSAFQGHTDPGNGVWNLGTFSYQHGASSPDEADRKQLNRLKQQASDIRYRAARSGIQLGLEEELNGIDLANQSPLAALGKPGYAEWLTEAYQRGLHGRDAILWARVQGYWDVQRGRWNAPGLGNTEPLIRQDQNRRMQAVAQAIAHSSFSVADDSQTMTFDSLERSESSSRNTSSNQANDSSTAHQVSASLPDVSSTPDGSLSFGLP